MVPDAVQKWLYGTQKEPVMVLPGKNSENSWVRSKRLSSLWYSPEFSVVTSLEERD